VEFGRRLRVAGGEGFGGGGARFCHDACRAGEEQKRQAAQDRV
jgi:hypothetical protein